MNIIRTKVVELSMIPAIAYKLKLASGGSGIKLHRTDVAETAFATLDKRSGGVVVDARVNAGLFPEAAFDEALDLLAGLPYSARGKVSIVVSEEIESDEIGVPENEATLDTASSISMVNSDEFKALIERFSDENGKINYPLMNKQFIQFASGSKTVTDLCEKKASTEDILLFIIQNRAAYLAGKRENISEEEAKALIETIDEIDPRSAFKELSLYIRKQLAR